MEVTIVYAPVTKDEYAQYRDQAIEADWFLAGENIDPIGVSEFTINAHNGVLHLRVTKDDFAELQFSPAG